MKTEKLLRAISNSAAVLFREDDFGKAVRKTLRNLGEAAGVCRVYLFENHTGSRGELVASQRYEWAAPGVSPQIDNQTLQNMKWSRFAALRNHLRAKPFHGIVKDMPSSLRKMLAPQEILSMALVPVHVSRSWYGFIGFDDCRREREWTSTEIAVLQVAANIMGGAIERRRGEERLRSILEDAIDSLNTGLFILDADFRVVWMNRSMEKFFGISRRRITGDDFRRFIRDRIDKIIVEHKEFKKRIQASYKNNSYVERFTCAVKPARGRKRRILTHWSSPITRGGLAGGRIEHYIDTTAIERANVALKLSEKKYRNLVENLSEGISYADEQEVIRYANRSFCETLGYGKEEIIGRRISDFFDAKGKMALARQSRLRKKGISSRYEISMRSASGEMVPLEVSASPVVDEEGRFRGSYGVFSDIRERKRVEEMKDDLLMDVSHELKAPTANIVMGLNLFKKHCPETMSAECALGFRMIEKEVTRIQKNIESLIDLSVFETGSAALSMRRFNLVALLRSVASAFEEIARERGLTLVVSSSGGTISLSGDRERIYHLFRNLLENSIKFSRTGTITISAMRRRGEILVSVADEGRGIEPARLELIFKKHYQRYPSDWGTGIGLTLCRHIVELHRGRIWAESEGMKKGMTVHVAFPVPPTRKGVYS